MTICSLYQNRHICATENGRNHENWKKRSFTLGNCGSHHRTRLFPVFSLSGQSREISVQTQHRASEDALLTGRTAATNQLTPGDVLDLNSATQAELEGLYGIGAAKAQAIIDYRDEYGNFLSVEELLEVDGIGAATLERIRPYLTVE